MKTRISRKATAVSDSPHEALERIFHEPSRLAIMSALCATREGLAFNDLKATCSLTDGNLNRHLKVLDEDGVIRIEKSFVGAKPRTMVHITKSGLNRFSDYLAALAEVLQNAQTAVLADERKPSALPAGRPVPA